MLIESLGFNCGQISVADFVSKYEGQIFASECKIFCPNTKFETQDVPGISLTTPEKHEETDGQIEDVEVTNMLSAEDCFSQLKKKIKEYHGVRNQHF